MMLLEALLVGYVPGAIMFRWPSAGRTARAALPPEERVFWMVILSVAVACMFGLTLAAAGIYTFARLVGALLGFGLLLAAGARGDLRLGPSAAKVGVSALVPAFLVAIGLWLYFPPAEYVVGGRDPGVYTEEGIQIAQRGSLFISDTLVATLPPHLRGLVFSMGQDRRVRRFMGFLILDPSAGTVVGQFPHLYPVSLALGYGIDGLTGVRRTTGVWAILGVLGVYFAGSLIFGRPAAAAAAGLLSLNVAQVWFARSPNSEVAFQALLFAAMAAYARMEATGARFFALAAAGLLGTLLFLRVDAVIVLALVAAALALNVAVGRHTRALFVLPLVGLAAAGTAYLMVFVRPYMDQPIGFLENLRLVHWVLAGVGLAGTAAGLGLLGRRKATPPAWLPAALAAAVVAAAVYGYFFRAPAGPLAPHDAYALRTFATHYLTPYLLAAAVAGYALTVPRMFWTHPLMVMLVTGFCGFFFYKIRIVPEHFWMARRFLSVILPATLLFAAAAVFPTPWRAFGGRSAWLVRALALVGIVMVAAASRDFLQETAPVLSHVEYAGVIPRLEHLAAQIGDDDLVIVESRGSSDLHVLGLPLAYVYARNVLVLVSDRPPATDFAELIAWAQQRYRRVLYMGFAGGTLLSRYVDAEFISDERFTVPEFERSWGRAPREVRRKAFEAGLWRFVSAPRSPDRVRVEIGGADDFMVEGFWAKETGGGYRFRWSTARAQVRLRLPAVEASQLAIWMGRGPRPPGVPASQVSVYVDDQLAGKVEVTAPEPQAFVLPLPADAVARAWRRDGFVVVRLETPTWSPRMAAGSSDLRNLGVMLTAVELR
jgi:hypothetical protein